MTYTESIDKGTLVVDIINKVNAYLDNVLFKWEKDAQDFYIYAELVHWLNVAIDNTGFLLAMNAYLGTSKHLKVSRAELENPEHKRIIVDKIVRWFI